MARPAQPPLRVRRCRVTPQTRLLLLEPESLPPSQAPPDAAAPGVAPAVASIDASPPEFEWPPSEADLDRVSIVASTPAPPPASLAILPPDPDSARPDDLMVFVPEQASPPSRDADPGPALA